MVAHHDAEALDDVLVQQAFQATQYLGFRQSGDRADCGVGARNERQAILDRGDQGIVLGVEALAGFRSRPLQAPAIGEGHGGAQIEAEVDVIVLHHRQAHDAQSRFLLDVVQHAIQVGRVGGGGDEPEIERMFAFVVVVDLRMAVHHLRDFGQARRGHGHGGEGADPDAVRPEHGPDAADDAVARETAQRLQHLLHAHAEAVRDDVEGRRSEREATLEIIEQTHLNVAHSPILWARGVKKIPLGLSAGSVPMRAKVSGS
jgi:hypothetical protein